MPTQLTRNGISTTVGKNQFAYEEYRDAVTSAPRVQWDYRDAEGRLFSGIAKTVEEAEQVAAKVGYVKTHHS